MLRDTKDVVDALEPAAIDAAKSKLAGTLREIAKKLGPQNDKILKGIATSLLEIVEDAATKRSVKN